MADIRVLTTGGGILLEHGWFHPGWGRSADAVRRELEPQLRAAFNVEADARFAAALEEFERIVAQWEALKAAGITDPTVMEPEVYRKPNRSAYDACPAVIVERIPANRNSGRIGGFIGQPFGEPVWLSVLAYGDGQVSCGGMQSSWSYTEEGAHAAAEAANKVDRAHYDRHVEGLREADEEDRRVLRDWEIITAAGLTPTFPKPDLQERVPERYDVWREAALEHLLKWRGPLYQVVRIEPNTPKPADS